MLAVGAGGGCLDIFSLICHFSFLSPSLWETARYRLKYCLEGPLNPKQPTNQPCKVGLCNFLFCFSQQLAILPATCMVSQYFALLWCVNHSKGENYHFMTNTPGKYDLYFILCWLNRIVSVRPTLFIHWL